MSSASRSSGSIAPDAVVISSGVHNKLLQQGSEEDARRRVASIPIVINPKSATTGEQGLLVIPDSKGSALNGQVIGIVKQNTDLRQLFARYKDNPDELQAQLLKVAAPLTPQNKSESEVAEADMPIAIPSQPVTPPSRHETLPEKHPPKAAPTEAPVKKLPPESPPIHTRPQDTEVRPLNGSLESLGIPDLHEIPQKPRFRVTFSMPDGARYTATYHWVWVSPTDDVYLIYDGRYDVGVQFEPPIRPDVPLLITVADKQYSCISRGYCLEFGIFRIICLPKYTGPEEFADKPQIIKPVETENTKRQARNEEQSAKDRLRIADMLAINDKEVLEDGVEFGADDHDFYVG